MGDEQENETSADDFTYLIGASIESIEVFAGDDWPTAVGVRTEEGENYRIATEDLDQMIPRRLEVETERKLELRHHLDSEDMYDVHNIKSGACLGTIMPNVDDEHYIFEPQPPVVLRIATMREVVGLMAIKEHQMIMRGASDDKYLEDE